MRDKLAKYRKRRETLQGRLARCERLWELEEARIRREQKEFEKLKKRLGEVDARELAGGHLEGLMPSILAFTADSAMGTMNLLDLIS